MVKRLAGSFLAVLGLTMPAYAATFTLDDYVVTLRDTDPGLVLYATDILATDYQFTLNNIGDVHTTALFEIGTTETTVNADDWVQYPISVDFSFSSPPPPFGGTSTGVTGGIVVPFTGCGIIFGGCGYVSWNNPAILSFGQFGDGQLAIWLSNVHFGTPGSATVYASFKLLNEATVPEPTSLLLVGLGLVGAGFHIRRRLRTAA